MRTFIALPLNDKVRDELGILQSALGKAGPDVKWVRPSNIHLTLQFLGEIDETQIKAVASRLRIIARKNRAFDMHLATIGAFPGFTAPRVLWVGIDSGVENCASLASQVKESLCALGVKSEERDFAPHITLGRVRSSKNIGVLMKILEKERQFSSQEKILIDRMILFQSKLSQQGPTYTPLEEFPLQ